LRELREYAGKGGWEVTGQYVARMSGTKDSRPQLDAMMKLAKARKLDAVVVWKLDRFGRSKSDIYRVCQTLGCMSAT
jgi:DNA invertase Pin-like site-specific DNA recombinase